MTFSALSNVIRGRTVAKRQVRVTYVAARAWPSVRLHVRLHPIQLVPIFHKGSFVRVLHAFALFTVGRRRVTKYKNASGVLRIVRGRWSLYNMNLIHFVFLKLSNALKTHF